MTTYVNIAKPNSTPYTAINATIGKQIYDDVLFTYDDATLFYDGVNPSQYTSVSKPNTTSYTNIPKPV